MKQHLTFLEQRFHCQESHDLTDLILTRPNIDDLVVVPDVVLACLEVDLVVVELPQHRLEVEQEELQVGVGLELEGPFLVEHVVVGDVLALVELADVDGHRDDLHSFLEGPAF